jgi:hypothetical protein
VLARAREIVGARTAPLDKARAIYDWIVDNTFRGHDKDVDGFWRQLSLNELVSQL